MVEALADDEMEGRDNQTDGSVLAQDFLVDQLGQFTEPLDGDTLDGYGHTVRRGHQPHRADPRWRPGRRVRRPGRPLRPPRLRTAGPTPPATTSATGRGDNASGVATVLEVGRLLAADPEPPPRTVILALWDAEEDGLRGSRGLRRRSARPAGGHRGLPELGHPGREPEPGTGRHDRRGRGRDRWPRTSSPPPRPPPRSSSLYDPRPEPPVRPGPQRPRQLRQRRRAHRLLHRRQPRPATTRPRTTSPTWTSTSWTSRS